MTTREKFYGVMAIVANIIMFVEFWTFVILRETHVINWSWLWLIALTVGSVVNEWTNLKRAGLSG